MPHLIDSDVLIFFVGGMPEARQLVERLLPLGTAISVIGYMETIEGLPRSPNPARARARFQSLLEVAPILALTVAEAHRCADLRAALRLEGRRVRSRSLDLLVAATALEHGLTLVTNNEADYRDIPDLAVLPAQFTF